MEKNTLQEMCQKNGRGLPKYALVSQGGPPNNPSFEVSVTVEWRNGETLEERAEAFGKKKEVEKMAARKMIDRLNQILSTVCKCAMKYISSPIILYNIIQ